VRRLQPHQTSRHRKYTPRRPEEEQTKGVVKHGYVQQKLLKRLLGIHHGIRVQISLSSSARLAKCAGGFHVYVFCRKPKHFRFVYNLKKRGAISWLQGEHAKEFAGFHSFDEKCAWQTWTWRTAKTLFYFLTHPLTTDECWWVPVFCQTEAHEWGDRGQGAREASTRGTECATCWWQKSRELYAGPVRSSKCFGRHMFFQRMSFDKTSKRSDGQCVVEDGFYNNDIRFMKIKAKQWLPPKGSQSGPPPTLIKVIKNINPRAITSSRFFFVPAFSISVFWTE
jgi:hypothetical protein